MTYKDKTFCASKTDKHTCGRELTNEQKGEAIRLNVPVAYAEFCEEVQVYNVTITRQEDNQDL